MAGQVGTHHPEVSHAADGLEGDTAICRGLQEELRHHFGVVIGIGTCHSICHYKNKRQVLPYT